MLIVNNMQKVTEKGVLNYLPRRVRGVLEKTDTQQLEEIRLRRWLPMVLVFGNGSFYITESGELKKTSDGTLRVGRSEIEEAMELITGSSVYAVEEEIKNGFITLNGGHRVGICGRTVMQDGEVAFIKDISGLNYRIAHEIYGAADGIIANIYDGTYVKNTLIISPPQCGKTTILRDIARLLSQENLKIGIVDERGEIAGMNDGKLGYDLGCSIDVLSFCKKDIGMTMMLRSMSPDVIITDEIGTLNDIEAINKLISSGVSVITTIHARDRYDLEKREDMKNLTGLFECLITLSRNSGAGTIEEIYK